MVKMHGREKKREIKKYSKKKLKKKREFADDGEKCDETKEIKTSKCESWVKTIRQRFKLVDIEESRMICFCDVRTQNKLETSATETRFKDIK